MQKDELKDRSIALADCNNFFCSCECPMLSIYGLILDVFIPTHWTGLHVVRLECIYNFRHLLS